MDQELVTAVEAIKTAILQSQYQAAKETTRVQLILYYGIGRYLSSKKGKTRMKHMNKSPKINDLNFKNLMSNSIFFNMFKQCRRWNYSWWWFFKPLCSIPIYLILNRTHFIFFITSKTLCYYCKLRHIIYLPILILILYH